jgi:hypothetical protein
MCRSKGNSVLSLIENKQNLNYEREERIHKTISDGLGHSRVE